MKFLVKHGKNQVSKDVSREQSADFETVFVFLGV